MKILMDADNAEAIKAGRNRPLVYNLSKEDCPNIFSETSENIAIRNREGSESGVLLDFINDMARRARKVNPDIQIETLAYQNTENPPEKINADDNVIITLCDTESILTDPITDPRNQDFADKVIGWSKKTKHLRIWDYGYCFMPEGWEYPIPTERTYQADYQFFRQYCVEGLFTQFEVLNGVVLGDMPDLKRWLIAKLMEDPSQDVDRLITTFTDGYYGPAGKFIREYRNLLNKAAKAKPPGYLLLCGCEHPTLHYLDVGFMVQAKQLFQKAQQVCGNDPILQKRVSHARASLDAAELMRSSMFMRQWQLEGKDINTFPLNPKAAGERLKKTLFEQAAQRTTKNDQDTTRALAAKIDLYAQIRSTWSLPAQVEKNKASQLYEFTPPAITRVYPPAEVVLDSTAESGLAIRISVSGPISPETRLLYAGICQSKLLPTQVVTINGPELKNSDIKANGYQWYKVLSNVTIQNDSRMFFAMPTAWNIQISCDTPGSLRHPQHYDVWAKLKFQGTAFSKDITAGDNSIYLERVLMVKK
jgi:hypothetical protein